MPVAILARLSRTVPLLIALAALAVILYFVVSYVRTPARAKEVLVEVFTVLCSAITIFSAVVSLYAVLDGNDAVFDLGVCFMAVGVVGLVATRICHHVFVKHNPHYAERARRARVIKRWPWKR